MKRALTIGICLLMAYAATAQVNNQFNGTVDTSWTNDANWSVGVKPTILDQARYRDVSGTLDGTGIAGKVSIGRAGNSTLTIGPTGHLTVGQIAISDRSGFFGGLIVDGGTVESIDTAYAAGINVGNKGLGDLTVKNGASITINDGGNIQVGNGFADTHTASFSGGSTVTLNSGGLKISTSAGSMGAVTVDDAGTLLDTWATLNVGHRAMGSLVLNDGTINVNGSAVNIANQDLTTAGSSVTINGGFLNVGNTINVGKFDSGSFSINDGTVLTGRLVLGNDVDGDSGLVNLLGGSITITNEGTGALMFESAGSVLDIQNDAAFTLLPHATNAVTLANTITTAVGAGNITWDNGTSTLGTTYGTGDNTWGNGTGSYLHKVYDEGTGEMHLWVDTVIPEPATLGLLVFIGLPAVFIRRRFLK